MFRRKSKYQKEWETKRRKIGPIQQKILLLLLGGLALSCARSSKQQWKILKGLGEEWKNIKRQRAERAITALYKSRLISMHMEKDNTCTVILNEDGKRKALTYNLGSMRIAKPEKWDGSWRIIVFDIPEEKRDGRDSLRAHLFNLGFHELQKSVWLHPFECKNEIEFLTELYEMRPYVRYILATFIDNEEHLKKIYHLSA